MSQRYPTNRFILRPWYLVVIIIIIIIVIILLFLLIPGKGKPPGKLGTNQRWKGKLEYFV